jgi:hypothetical protein
MILYLFHRFDRLHEIHRIKAKAFEWYTCGLAQSSVAFTYMSSKAYSHLAEHSSLSLILFSIERVSYNMDKHQHISLPMIVIVSFDPEGSPSDDISYDGTHSFTYFRTVE